MHFLSALLTTLFLMTVATVATAQTEAVLGDADSGPAVLFDGREITQEELAALSPEQIGDIRILDGEKAAAEFGKYGAHGVVVVTSAGRAAAQVIEPEVAVTTAPAPEGTVRASLPEAGYYEIDGRPATAEDVRALDPATIESVQVFKGSEAEIRFGPSAKEGAVSVITKG